MDAKLVAQLKKAREQTEELEQRLFAELEKERDHIATLKAELKIRLPKREALVIELLDLGYTSARISKSAGLVPSAITYFQNKEPKK